MKILEKDWDKIKKVELICNKCGSDHIVVGEDDNISFSEFGVTGICDVCNDVYQVSWGSVKVTLK